MDLCCVCVCLLVKMECDTFVWPPSPSLLDANEPASRIHTKQTDDHKSFSFFYYWIFIFATKTMTIPLLLLVCSNSHSCNTRTKINRHVHWMPVCSADHRQCRCCCYWFSFVASDASTFSVFIANRELLHHLSHSSLLFRQWILLLASKYAITCKRIRKWFLRTINFSLELKFYYSTIVCLCVPLPAKLGWIDRQHLLTLKIFLFRLHNAPGIFTHAKRSIQRTHILIFAASPVSAQLPTRCVHFSVFFSSSKENFPKIVAMACV